MSDSVYINGSFLPREMASVSIFDRGLLFGDSVYEVIPVYDRKVFFAARHLKRLQQSLESANMRLPEIDWSSVFQQLIDETARDNLQIYLQITRGNEGRRRHDIDTSLKQTVIAFTLDTPYPSAEKKRLGLKAMVVRDIRWDLCQIKTNSMIANVLMNDQAVKAGFDTALLNRNGFLTEGSSSNVFVVSDNEIYSPPMDNHALPGVTQQIALQLMQENDLPVHVQPIAIETLYKAQEIWITSTTKEIFPVTQLDSHTVGNGKGGAVWQKMDTLFQQLKNESP